MIKNSQIATTRFLWASVIRINIDMWREEAMDTLQAKRNNNILAYNILTIRQYYNITHFENFHSDFWRNEKGILILSSKGRRLIEGRFQKTFIEETGTAYAAPVFLQACNMFRRKSATSSLHISTPLQAQFFDPRNSKFLALRAHARVVQVSTLEYIFFDCTT